MSGSKPPQVVHKKTIWSSIVKVLGLVVLWATAHIRATGSDFVWGKLSEGLLVNHALPIVATVFLFYVMFRNYNAVKNEGPKWVFVPWFLVFLSCALSILRSYDRPRVLFDKLEVKVIERFHKQDPVWISDNESEDFLRAAINLPRPPKPIIIALSSQSHDVRIGGDQIRKLLEQAYPGWVMQGYAYNIFHYKGGIYKPHKYLVVYSPNVKQGDPVMVAAKALEAAFKSMNTSGSHSYDLKDDELCVFVEDFNAKDN